MSGQLYTAHIISTNDKRAVFADAGDFQQVSPSILRAETSAGPLLVNWTNTLAILSVAQPAPSEAPSLRVVTEDGESLPAS